MKKLQVSVRVFVLVIIGVLFVNGCVFSTAAQTPTSHISSGQASLVFGDEFNGSELDLAKWYLFSGTPIESGGWITLAGANIQSKTEFTGGVLTGIIRSTDWRPLGEFTDSSFGFEIWGGADGICHYGVIFKASGQLGLLRSQPDAEGKCKDQSKNIPGHTVPDDPVYQDFIAIPNWDAMKASNTLAFTLTWSSSVTLEVSDGSLVGLVFTDTSPAIPSVPLRIRLYAHTFAAPLSTDTFALDYVRLYADHVVYLPVISREGYLPNAVGVTPG